MVVYANYLLTGTSLLYGMIYLWQLVLSQIISLMKQDLLQVGLVKEATVLGVKGVQFGNKQSHLSPCNKEET